MEIWKDIKGYEGLYQVSNKGRVKSLKYNKTKKEKVLKSSTNNAGYLSVELWKYGERKKCYIHRLVATAFIDNQENNLEINHKDENPENNSIENLEWCNRKYNNNYGTHNQKVSEALRVPIDMLTREGELIKQFACGKEAVNWLKENGFPTANKSNISYCCNGKIKTAYGYKWLYKTPS